MFGLSKQAYYKRIKSSEKKQYINDKVIEMVENARKRQPKMGTRKLYEKIQPELKEHNIKMGRDALFRVLRNNGMLIKPKFVNRVKNSNDRH